MAGHKRWIYLGFLIVSGAAFLIDRLFFGEPEPAAAQTASAPQPSRKTSRAAKAAAQDQDGATRDVSLDWLAKLQPTPAKRDLFTPTMQMLMRYQNLQASLDQDDRQDEGPQPGSAEAFESNYKLQATFVSDDLLLAVVSGRLLRPGDTLDGFHLTRVEPHCAEFHKGEDCVTLAIDPPPKTEQP